MEGAQQCFFMYLPAVRCAADHRCDWKVLTGPSAAIADVGPHREVGALALLPSRRLEGGLSSLVWHYWSDAALIKTTGRCWFVDGVAVESPMAVSNRLFGKTCRGVVCNLLISNARSIFSGVSAQLCHNRLLSSAMPLTASARSFPTRPLFADLKNINTAAYRANTDYANRKCDGAFIATKCIFAQQWLAEIVGDADGRGAQHLAPFGTIHPGRRPRHRIRLQYHATTSSAGRWFLNKPRLRT